MEELLTWVGNILFFLIFFTALENLLPGKTYCRYIRLFAGMVVILIVVKPLTQGLNLEERIGYYFETFTFRQEARDLSREILGMEQQRLGRIMERYEEAVKTDLEAMAHDMGYVPVQTKVVIDGDADSENYGAVVRVEMEVQGEMAEEEPNRAVQAVNPVEPVTVSLEGMAVRKGEGLSSGKGKTEEERQGEEELDGLRRKVEGYYGLETEKVDIQFQGR